MPSPKSTGVAAAGDVRHVFISYQHSHASMVDELVAELEDQYRLWRDVDKNRSGQLWRENVARAIQSAYAMIVVVSPNVHQSKEVYAEYFYAIGIELPIIPLLVTEECELPPGLEGLHACFWYRDRAQNLAALRTDLDQYGVEAPPLEAIDPERDYLNSVQLAYLRSVQNYTPMAGQTRRRRRGSAVQSQAVVMRPPIRIRRHSPLMAGAQAEEVIREYEDLPQALAELDRVVVLGDPGAGKTTTLYKYADQLRRHALAEPGSPLPLIVPLGEWRGQSWEELLKQQLGALAGRCRRLLAEGRLYLLLDGLNEMPRDRCHRIKIEYLRRAFDSGVRAVVTCRELDYRARELALDVDTIEIHPLNPRRILEFLQTYLGAIQGVEQGTESARELFWQIGGGEKVESVWETWQSAGADLDLFFQSPDIPGDAPNVYAKTTDAEDAIWRGKVRTPANLIRLAANPYLLWIFLSIYLDLHEIPANRGALFDEFAFLLLQREGLTEGEEPNAEGRDLLEALETVAWSLQTGGNPGPLRAAAN